jgi:hypothetical protein
LAAATLEQHGYVYAQIGERLIGTFAMLRYRSANVTDATEYGC